MSLFLLGLPFSVFAAEDAVTRRDGFLLMWESLRRPLFPTREAPYKDVPKGSKGSDEITYAKARGILDDGETFRPDDGLQLHEALVLLFRTRNIENPDEITTTTLSDFVERYPIAQLPSEYRQTEKISQQQLLTLMQSLDSKLSQEDHEVSLYAEKFHGKGTAFGETFDMYALTAAHRTFPSNTLVRVTNIENGKSVVVRINDRGPFVKGRDMDLSLAAFTTIAERSKGKFRARFERLGDAALTEITHKASCKPDARVQQRIARDVHFLTGIPHRFGLNDTLTLRANKPFVVRSIRYPDGVDNGVQDWVLDGEEFIFKPSMVGDYVFQIGIREGRNRAMKMSVVSCG